MRAADDARWLAELVSAHEGGMLRYATGIVGAALAPDLVQETFLRLCRQERAAVEGHAVPWLFRVLRNQCWTALRRQGRATTDSMLEGVASHAADPERQLEGRQGADVALRAMAELPRRQGEAVHLKLCAGLSYQEIAVVMDTSTGNVGALLHQGLQRVRAAVVAAQASRVHGDAEAEAAAVAAGEGGA